MFKLFVIILILFSFTIKSQDITSAIKTLEGKWYCAYYLDGVDGSDTITPIRSKKLITVDFELVEDNDKGIIYSFNIDNKLIYKTSFEVDLQDTILTTEIRMIPDELGLFNYVSENRTYEIDIKSDSVFALKVSNSKRYGFLFHKDPTYAIQNYYLERLAEQKPDLFGKWNWNISYGGFANFTPEDVGFNLSIIFKEYKAERPDSIICEIYREDSLCISKPINLEINHNNHLGTNDSIFPKDFPIFFPYEPLYGTNWQFFSLYISENNLVMRKLGVVDDYTHYFYQDSTEIIAWQKTIRDSLAKRIKSDWYLNIPGSDLRLYKYDIATSDKITMQFVYDSLTVSNDSIECNFYQNDILITQTLIGINYHTDSSLVFSNTLFPADFVFLKIQAQQ